MPQPPVPASPAPGELLEARREQVIQSLSTHFADDRLSLDEFEKRMELVYRAGTPAQLDALVADMPQPAAVAPAARHAAPAVTGDSADRGRVATIFGTTERLGRWLVPRRLDLVSVVGSAELDFREAQLADPVTEIHVRAIVGSVELIVPPGIRVEWAGSTFLGSFESDRRDDPPLPADAPLLRLTGRAVLGSIEVRTGIRRDS